MWKTDANSVIQTFGKSALSASSNLRECQCLTWTHRPGWTPWRTPWSVLVSPREGRTPARATVVDLSSATSLPRPEWALSPICMLVLVTVVSAMSAIILLVKVFIRDKATVLEHSAGMRQLTVVSIVINALSLILPLNHPGAAWNCQLGHWLWQSWLPWSLHRGLLTFTNTTTNTITNTSTNTNTSWVPWGLHRGFLTFLTLVLIIIGTKKRT